VLRLANFYYSRGDLLKTVNLLQEHELFYFDCGQDCTCYHEHLHNAFDFQLFVNMSQCEMTSSILNCFSNVKTTETRGISCLYQKAFNQTPIDVVYILHEIPCVGKPIVHELVSTCFDTLEMYRGCVVIPYQVFEFYLRCGCCYSIH
jgi:hypothetical protein